MQECPTNRDRDTNKLGIKKEEADKKTTYICNINRWYLQQ